MRDEDRSQELPQNGRGPARAGPRPSAPPVLSDELRQRLRASVAAERAAAAPPQDDQAPAEASPLPTRPGPAGRDVVSPAGHGISRRGPSAPPVLSDELRQRLRASVAAERAAAAPPQDDQAPAEASPRQQPSGQKKPVRRRLGPARLVAALVVIVTGALGAALSLYYVRAPASVPLAAQRQELMSRDQTAAWVAQQVSHSAIVACDQLMCSALAADRFPSRNLRVLGPATPYLVTSAVVVVTADVRDMFGTSLSANWAPAVLATFGSGNAEISVRVVAPHGAAAYLTAASADLTARETSGHALLEVPDIVASATARKQLMAGQVDSRLMLAIADLAADGPIDIVDFGNMAPGEGTDIPFRFADLAVNDQVAGRLGGSAYVRSLVADLSAVSMQFRPASIGTVVLPRALVVLRVQFTAPSPLGLLGP
jgi:hypothetical protein